MKKLIILLVLLLGMSACVQEQVEYVEASTEARKVMDATEMKAYLEGVNVDEINAMNTADYLLSQYRNVAYEVIDLIDGEYDYSEFKVLNDDEGNRRMYYQGNAGLAVNDSIHKGIGYIDVDGSCSLMVFPTETYAQETFAYFHYEVGENPEFSIINGQLVVDSVRSDEYFEEVSRAYLNMGSLRLEKEIVNCYFVADDSFMYSSVKTAHYDTDTYLPSTGYDYITDPSAEQVSLTIFDTLSDGSTGERQVSVRKGTQVEFPYYLYEDRVYYDEAGSQEVDEYITLNEDTTVYIK